MGSSVCGFRDRIVAAVNAPKACRESTVPSPAWTVTLACGLIVLATLAAYHNCFAVPFFFDDVDSISQNTTIRHLWPISSVLSPPQTEGFTVTGRPFLNLSLAINYAFGGATVRGYHATNLVIHVFAGLILFGVVRRTLQRPVLHEKFQTSAVPLALAVAVLWTVHPLQTEAVTYVVQRAESLMSLFYLLTLYCFIRGTESQRSGFWLACSIVACVLGMATKEVMVSAPLMVLLYDRTFVAGSFAEAWGKRWRWYAGLACTWVVAGWLLLGVGNKAGAAGFGTGGILWWQYALTQCWAIVRYLRLCVWPVGQVFDYGTMVFRHTTEVIPDLLILVILLTGTGLGLVYRPCLGFLGAWFFLILAPSSSVMPVATQSIAEHRMYLPLAAVVTLVVMGIHTLLGRRSGVIFLGMAMGLALLTGWRNEDYQSELAIWSDTVAKCPGNARAHTNLGNALLAAGRPTEAIKQCELALRIEPDYAQAHNGLGAALQQTGEIQEAIEQYEWALRLKPRDPEVHYNLGVALLGLHRATEAVEHFEHALRRKPYDADTHYNLGVALLGLDKMPEAIEHFEQALRINPDYADAHYTLGVALIRQGKLPEAVAHLEQFLRIRPSHADAHNNLGVALVRQRRLPEAIGHFEQALRIKPEYAEAHNNLGIALEQMGRVREAIGHYEKAVRIQPDDADAQDNLARARAAQ